MFHAVNGFNPTIVEGFPPFCRRELGMVEEIPPATSDIGLPSWKDFTLQEASHIESSWKNFPCYLQLRAPFVSL